MFALVFLALVQMLVLPGLLIAGRLQLGSGIAKVLAVVTSSLLANTLLVELLVALHRYRQSNILIIIGLELAALWWLHRKSTGQQAKTPAPWSLAAVVGVTLGIMALGMTLWQWWDEVPSVFEGHDAIASWNKWAVRWSGNTWPLDTWSYPQLLPANWSLIYLMSKSSQTEIFARAVMGLFPVLACLAFLDLCRRASRPGYGVGSLCFLMLSACVLGNNRFDGFADLPVAVLGFLGIYFCLICLESPAEDAAKTNSLMVAAVLALTAGCLCKQMGQLVAPLTMIWLASTKQGRAAICRAALPAWFWLAAVLISFHWYVVRFFVDQAADNVLVTHLLQDIHEGRNLWERLLAGLGGYQMSLKPIPAPVLIFVMACIAASLIQAHSRRLFSILFVPLLAVWALGFSYDIRNSAAVLPIAALLVANGADLLWPRAALFRARLGPLCRPRALVVIGLALAGGLAFIPSGNMREIHRGAQRDAGDPRFNRLLNEVARDDGRVIAPRYHFRLLPVFQGRTTHSVRPLSPDSDLVARLARHRWMILPAGLGEDEQKTLEALLASGALRQATSDAFWYLYEIDPTKLDAAKTPK